MGALPFILPFIFNYVDDIVVKFSSKLNTAQ